MRDPKKDIPKAGSIVDSIQDKKTWGPDLWKTLSIEPQGTTSALEVDGVGCLIRYTTTFSDVLTFMPNVKIEDIPGEGEKVAGRKLVAGFKTF